MAKVDFKFLSDAITGNSPFTVINFSGYEAISRLYQYQIELKASITAAIILDDLLDNPAHFITTLDGIDYPVDGVLSSIEELTRETGYVYYRAVLVPRLWWLSIYKTNQIYTATEPGTSIDTILTEILDNANNGAGLDYDVTNLDSKTDFLQRDYRCQFAESDFDFISRLLENEGIFYYFKHDGVAETIVFLDDNSYEAIDPDKLIFEAKNQTKDLYNSVDAWSCRKQRLPRSVMLKDYNSVHPSLAINSESAIIDPLGPGTEYSYGDYIKDEIEAATLSNIRYQENLCNKTRYFAESSVARLQAGYTFKLKHPHYDGLYLTLEVNHEGRNLDTVGQQDSNQEAQYQNSFIAIEAAEQFRPARLTPKPRFYGTMTAFIHASQGTDGTEIGDENSPDEAGRYLVHLPFDQTYDLANNLSDDTRKTSAWIRMAQSSVGFEQGSYFPLKEGTEVLLTFINGDPDRPVITAALPNTDTPSLLTASNDTESIIQTTGPLIENIGVSDPLKIKDFTKLENTVIKEANVLKNECPVPPDHDDSDEVKQGTYVDGHKNIQTEGSFAIHAQTQYKNKNLLTSHSSSWNPVTYGDPWLIDDKQNTPPTLSEIKFELLDDRVILDAGNRDMMIKCNHFDVDNVSEINQTTGHDHAVHKGTSFEKFFGNAEEHFIGEKVETFCGTMTGLNEQDAGRRKLEADAARQSADAAKSAADAARATADSSGLAADQERATNLEEQAKQAEKFAQTEESQIARGKSTATITDTDITETFNNCTSTETFNGGTKTEIVNADSKSFQNWHSFEFFGGAKEEINIAHTFEFYGGIKEELFVSGELSLGTGIKLDFNFAGGVEWAPFMFEIDSIQGKISDAKVEKSIATVKSEVSTVQKQVAAINKIEIMLLDGQITTKSAVTMLELVKGIKVVA